MTTFYKFAAWWGGQEGSLLFWSWVCGDVCRDRGFHQPAQIPRHDALGDVAAMVAETYFLTLIAFVVSPFGVLDAGRGNVVDGVGRGLNPLLSIGPW